MRNRLFFTLLMFYCQSVFGAEQSYLKDCGCSALAGQAARIEIPTINLPQCPCKQLSYLKNTFAEVVAEPMVKYKDAFLTLMWGLKEDIEQKRGEMSLESHNINMSITYEQLKKHKENPVEQLQCILCPLVKHFGYAQLTSGDYKTFICNHSDGVAVFGGEEMFGGIIYLNPDLNEVAQKLLDRSSQ
ncbi:MAG: hypothetical protein K2X98_02050 [Alphaproteobacteria bacterium]|nr:hypothetical protein [Alphaproteobacteria bacterium]